MNAEIFTPPVELPEADAAEQKLPVDDTLDEAGLDPRQVKLPLEAAEPDVVDQAVVVPLPDDDYPSAGDAAD
jgi:hypothetical protein